MISEAYLAVYFRPPFVWKMVPCQLVMGTTSQENGDLISVPIAFNIPHYVISLGVRGGVAVKALRYKPAGRGFDSRWCHWNFSVT